MPSFVLNSVSISARKHGFVCLLLFVLSLFSMAMATNSMISPSPNMMSMEAHTMSELSVHHMSSEEGYSCVSASADECSSLTSEHNHQNCMDNHCSSFSGLLVSYHSASDNVSCVHTALSSEFYVSTHPNTPYFPPIFIS
ncbi:hypothetical protein [Marinomonas mediterranea]|uniref:Uncharacterized protein n=1 Tax=Marinomonas mediterranea (strain ATCC 700492 / JCM 21426 / NBRC 103028 / MMB-1) TaxID=717774 RepID=F2JUB2_MARM1|nr:hypothetical protein [Marinomonas mediterranea]ADZ92731.1 hypothetical protein Marme_3517 [Marinomonas mediterranea MMB-1]WCN10661.1 hypothetical protein GV055_17890 [Marinomonas mediterranea]WCN14718.1 hypothetical protein GV054_17765 [Marinomonas mediterranea]WCN18759.1 hypothetical protein GV053_17795 [Marinomonas mediterranea MMB-1]